MAVARNQPKVIVVMPAYNAAKTLRITYDAIPKDDVYQVILVDDGSRDETLKIAKELNLEVFVHTRNFVRRARTGRQATVSVSTGLGCRRLRS
jgi:glycosyltransferase involved in cell wall biosynthesis